ncbi:hypothetical protein MMC12_005544 [Toensbergia leucococca]|nr:hypothetical protein [Toensbergia leucococca]
MKENRRRRIFNRLSKAFWILEILELILAILILAFTGSASQGFTRDLRYPTVPGKLVYNVFIAAFTMVSLAIMIPLDVWRPQTWGRWNMIFMPWPRVAVNVVFVVTWAGAIGSAFYTCGELCSAAESNFGCLTYATLSCDCSLRAFGICDLTRRVYFEQRSYRYEATQALDALIL